MNQTAKRLISRIGLLASLCLVGASCGSDRATNQEAADSEVTAGTATEARKATTIKPGEPTADEGVASPPTPGSEPDESPSTTTTQLADSSVSSNSQTSSTTKSAPSAGCAEFCNLVMEGDSLTDGFEGWVCAEFPNTTCHNSGVIAHRVDQMADTAKQDVDPRVSSGSGDVIVLWAGTNDLWQEFYSDDPDTNAKEIYRAISSYIRDRRNAGWDVVGVATLPPLNPDAIQGDERLNELIRANTAGADFIIDIAVDPALANPFDEYLRAPDGVHFTDPGRDVTVYGNIVPALKKLGLT